MATTLKGRQAWLTKQGNQVTRTVTRLEGLFDPAQLDAPDTLRQMQLGIREVELRHATLEKALREFALAVDSTTLTEENQVKADQNISAAQEILDQAQNLTVRLLLHLEGAQADKKAKDGSEQCRPSLPQLQIPKFRGEPWEWDQFWGIFEATVHCRNMSKIEKLHYLLEALQGPARDAVQDIQISEDNYDLAVELLHRRYGRQDAIVERLLTNLESLLPNSRRFTDQRRILDKITPILSQLKRKGELIDTQQMKRTILGKFSDKVQRAILKRKHLAPELWTTDQLLKELQDYFDLEDEIQVGKGIAEDENRRTFRTKEFQRPSKPHAAPANTASPAGQPRKFPCFYCLRTDHAPISCQRFPSYATRIAEIQRRDLCRNCGSDQHKLASCTRGACRSCNKKGHHTSICKGTAQSESEPSSFQPKAGPYTKPQQAAKPKKAGASSQRTTTTVTTQNVSAVIAHQETATCRLGKDAILRTSKRHSSDNGKVDLLVGQARIWNNRKKEFEDTFILLDSGADQSFVTADYADHLGLQDNGSLHLSINTFGNASPVDRTCTTALIRVEDRKGDRHEVTVAVIDHIAGKIQRSPLGDADKAYLVKHGLNLSISSRERTVEPHILLGCGDMFAFFDKEFGTSHDLPSGLKLVHSRIGYLVTGRNKNVKKQTSVSLHTLRTSPSYHPEETEPQWEQFWNLDSAGIEEYAGPQAKEMEDQNRKVWDQFRATVERRDDGYHVRLPWKEHTQDLPNNRTIAYNRLRAVLIKLKDQPDILRQYDNTFKEQLVKGILEEVDEGKEPDGKVVHYLAHQAILTPHKDTTKLRVVFDGSAHHKDAPCLNDKLHQGPVIMPPLIDMLNRFRIGNIAIISDVEKAFLQVHLQTVDRDATRCLWIRDIDQPLTPSNMVTYRFTRVTFGLNCSPFLLGATIMEHLQQAEDRELADSIKDNIYVDNILMSASSPEEAVDRCIRARNLFAEINMNLREFRTNSKEANQQLPVGCLAASTTPKVLGVQWDSDRDTMTIACRYPDKAQITKRSVSEQVAAVYDPLGWLTPLTVRLKIFLQQLWKHTYTWDQQLSVDHKRQWIGLLETVQGFSKCLPRMVADGSATSPATLVAFSDASKVAMATCVYVVQYGRPRLLIAKSKLPPIRGNPTIPKLEMHALTMGARLINSTYGAIHGRVKIEEVTVFSDSEIALSWLKNSSLDHKVGVMVRNRAKEIRRISAHLEQDQVRMTFGYVDTTLNPADHGTRGLGRGDLSENHIWWDGPPFLREARENWPPTAELVKADDESSVPITSVLATSSSQPHIAELVDWKRHSSLLRAVHSFAFALRWLERISHRINPDLQERLFTKIPELCHHNNDDFITVPESERALTLLLRNHQQIHVEGQLKSHHERLNPFKDSNGLIRCRGRLQRSELPEESRTPILIGANTPLALLIIRQAHGSFHLSTAHTMAKVRERYWIPQLRRQVQKAIRRSVPCQKMNNLPFKYPEMSDLPARRVVRSRPFQHVGIDYFGPITVQTEAGELSKAYGIIVTCMACRLLHLEAVHNMSTEQLLHALRRFFARRGIPETITSDNGPYFLLADQILNNAATRAEYDTTITQAMAVKGIQWRTITPYAPWQGAFYERLIKSVKYSLYKAVGKSTPTMDVLTTLLVEIEGTLNTRPLTYQEEHWEDHPTIRPIDFIQRDMIITYPMEAVGMDKDDEDYDPSTETAQLQTRRQIEEALRSSHRYTEVFWKVWSEQYITALREQHVRSMPGNHGTPKRPEQGQVVLVADSNLPRNTWKIGRIKTINTNAEGIAREAEVMMPNRRIIKRPLNHLIPLEVQDDTPMNSTPTTDTLGDEPQHTPANRHQPANPEKQPGEQRYNLRRRPRVDYSQLDFGGPLSVRSLFTILTLVATTLANPNKPPNVVGLGTTKGSIQCTKNGLRIETSAMASYELCAEGYCITRTNPPLEEIVPIPPEITLHPHSIHWKISNGKKLKMMEVQCPAIPFCSRIDCWFCTANVFNPECQPRAALITVAVLIYVTTALLYTLCYVPVVIGYPVRIVSRYGAMLLRQCCRCLIFFVRWYQNRRIRQQRRRRPTAQLGFVLLILFMGILHPAAGCQDVDIFEHRTTICTTSRDLQQICKTDITEVVKLNSFNREACFRLTRKGHLVKEIRVEWIALSLLCERQTIMFTRPTVQKVLDSKRCSHAGSCIDNKCAGINTTTLLPELHQANGYPGITFCVESCGGPGCGCFYLSSGCLFYRIYAKPVNDDVFELFRCARWNAAISVEVKITEQNKTTQRTRVALTPTIPQEIDTMKMTLSSLGVPPTPALQSTFFTDGTNVALWTRDELPPLQCASEQDARVLSCEVRTNCKCQPAEIAVRCVCADHDLAAEFSTNVRTRLPIRRPWIAFEEYHQAPDKISVRAAPDRISVRAIIPSLSTAEVLITINEQFDATQKEVTDSICKVHDTEISGCYYCAQGAVARIVCNTDDDSIIATIRCAEHVFSVPCSSQGVESTLRFNFQKAQIHLSCTSSCGAKKTPFEITGILHWTKTISTVAETILAGESTLYNELVLPDLAHIAGVFVSWYKTLLITLVILLVAVATGYLFLWSCGIQGLQLLARLLCGSLHCAISAVMAALVRLGRSVSNCPRRRRRHAYKEL